MRRARGRAVAVTPRDDELPFLDDGVAGTLTRKRSWWMEPALGGVRTGVTAGALLCDAAGADGRLAGRYAVDDPIWPPDELDGDRR